MKKIIIGMLALASFMFSANSQETRKMNHHKDHHGKGMMMKELGLSATQKEQMKAVRESTRTQLVELEKNDNLSVKDYKARKEAILQSQKEQMDKVLTIEQKKQLAQIESNRKVNYSKQTDKDNKMDKMKAHLGLSDEQVSKMKANDEAFRAKAKAIKENGQLSESEKKEQLMSLKQAKKNSFKQLLTPEQISKMEKKKKERKGKPGRK